MLSHDDKKAGLTVTSRLETTVVAGALCPRVREGGEPLVLFAVMPQHQNILVMPRRHAPLHALLLQEDAGGHLLSVGDEGEAAAGG